MRGNLNHCLVSRDFRQEARVNAIDFKKNDGRLYPGAFVAIQVSLAFGDMERIGGSDLVQIAVTVEMDVLRLRDCRLNGILAAHSVQTTPRFNLMLVNRVDLVPRQKVGLLFQWESLSCARLLSETPKQTGMHSARLPKRVLKLRIGSMPDVGPLFIHQSW